jgi:flagellar motor switch protein FliM
MLSVIRRAFFRCELMKGAEKPIGLDVPNSTVSELRPRTQRRASAVPGEPVAYDFRHPTKLAREHVRLLQMTYETFARRLTTVLTSGLRQVCQVTVSEVTQQSYDDYIGGLPTPTLMVPIDVSPLTGTGVLEMSLPIALAAIDHLLGGPGGNQQNRSLTDIEVTLLDGLLDQILGVLRYSFESIIAIQPTAGPIEYNPPFLQAASAADAVVVGEFDMIVGREQSRLTICLPLAPLLPILIAQRPREVPPLGFQSSLDLAAHRVRQRLGDVDVEVSVRFRPVGLSPTRLMNLAVGDVLVLDHRFGAPLTVEVDGTAFVQAVAGKSGTRLAALVVDSPVPPLKENE